MKKLVLAVLVVSTLFACNNTSNNESANSKSNNNYSNINKNTNGPGELDHEFAEDSPLKYTLKTLDVKEADCVDSTNSDTKCVYVFFEYPVFTGKNAEKVNVLIHNKLSETLGIGAKSEGELIDLNESALKFIEAHEDNARTTGFEGLWYAESRVMGHTVYKGYLSLKMETVFMMGGAHPMTYYNIYVFDLATGEPINLVEHIVDFESFQMLAEFTFRKALNYQDNQNLNSKGFEFREDKFVLPTNIGIAKNGIELLYNSYEIAPYSKGATTVVISHEDADGLIDFSHKTHVHNH